MTKIEKESLFIDLKTNIDKAEHIAEKVIREYDLDSQNPDDIDDQVFAGNRNSMWIDMEMLTDYIKSIRKCYEAIEKAVMV